MGWAPHPHPGTEPADPGTGPSGGALGLVAEILDPVLVPLGFAPGQVGVGDGRGQVIFCRGDVDRAEDGSCVDLVVDVAAAPDWRIVDVRYWGFPADQWHLDFDRDAALAAQLAGLARTLTGQLA